MQRLSPVCYLSSNHGSLTIVFLRQCLYDGVMEISILKRNESQATTWPYNTASFRVWKHRCYNLAVNKISALTKTPYVLASRIRDIL